MIRSMTQNDAEPVAGLIRQAFGVIETPLDPPPSALRETPESIRAHLQGGGGAVCEQDTLAGCILWREQDAGLYLCRLAVLPPYRRRGIAQHLIARAETEARARRLPRLHLGVRLRLHANRRLFAAAGFVEGARHAHPGYDAPTFADAEKHLA